MLNGDVHPDFADVVAVLSRQMPRGPGGAAVCVFYRGRKVVDVWGGTRDRQGSPWLQDTTAQSFSSAKGVLSTLLHILVDRGLAGYDDPVARFWPEFGVHGKADISIRHILCHEAGLYRLDEMISRPGEMLDWNHMKQMVAAARPAHEPGAYTGYHAVTYGWLLGGVIEAVGGRPLQQILIDELVEPLGLDGLFFGMPEDQLHRRARLIRNDGVVQLPRFTHGWQSRVAEWLEFGLEKVGVELAEFRSAVMANEPFDWNDESAVKAIIPAVNGQCTARSLARMYAMLAGGGTIDGTRLLSTERVREIGTVCNRRRDRVLIIPMHWRLGFHRVFVLGMSAPEAFGHFGLGGSGGFCDPSRDLAVAMTVNDGVGTPAGDSRMPRIARAALKCVERLRRR